MFALVALRRSCRPESRSADKTECLAAPRGEGWVVCAEPITGSIPHLCQSGSSGGPRGCGCLERVPERCSPEGAAGKVSIRRPKLHHDRAIFSRTPTRGLLAFPMRELTRSARGWDFEASTTASISGKEALLSRRDVFESSTREHINGASGGGRSMMRGKQGQEATATMS